MSNCRLLPIRCVVSLLLCAVALACPAAEPLPSSWKAGVATVAITPEGPIWMAGYAARNKPSEGKATELYAKSLVVEDANGARLAIVTLDLVGVPRALRDAVAKEVEARHSVPATALLINVSHTHCGPVVRSGGSVTYNLPPDQDARVATYVSRLQGQLVEVVGKAVADLKPAKLSYTHSRCGFAMNRRLPSERGYQNSPNPEGIVDHHVTVLKVEGADDKLRAILFGYACHNTTLSFYELCGDYAGFAQQYLEEAHPGTTALFMLGCGGDQNPYPRGTLELAKQHGRSLATAVDAALLPKARPISGPLSVVMQEAQLDFAPPPTREALLAQQKSTDKYDARKATILLEELDKAGKIKTTYDYPIQVARFGDDLLLVSLAGEVVADYSHRIRRELQPKGAANDPVVWVAGYSHDVFGYIPSLRILKEGGYEGGGAMRFTPFPGPWAENVEERIVAKVHELVKEARK